MLQSVPLRTMSIPDPPGRASPLGVVLRRGIVRVPRHSDEPASDYWVARYLAEATARFHRSLDAAVVADQVLQAFVPRLARAALLHLWSPDGRLVPVGVTHVDPAVQQRLRQSLPQLEVAAQVARPLLDAPGQRLLQPTDLPGIFPGASEDTVALLRAGHEEDCWVMAVPGLDEPYGLLTVFGRSSLGPGSDQLRTMLVVRAGPALDHAATVAEHAAVAAQLHQAVVPDLPPVVGGIAVAARYDAAGPSGEAGGDFLDAHPTRGGLTAVLGDVQGHGVGALTTSALCRLTFRGLAGDDHRPRQVLQRLDEVLHDHFAAQPDPDPGAFVTACGTRLRRRMRGGGRGLCRDRRSSATAAADQVRGHACEE